MMRYQLQKKVDPAAEAPVEPVESVEDAAMDEQIDEGREWAGELYEGTEPPDGPGADAFAGFSHPTGDSAWLDRLDDGTITGWVLTAEGEVYEYTDPDAWSADVDGAQMVEDFGPDAPREDPDADMEDPDAEGDEDPADEDEDPDAELGDPAEAPGDDWTEDDALAGDEGEDPEGDDYPTDADEDDTGDEAEQEPGEGDDDEDEDDPMERFKKGSEGKTFPVPVAPGAPPLLMRVTPRG